MRWEGFPMPYITICSFSLSWSRVRCWKHTLISSRCPCIWTCLNLKLGQSATGPRNQILERFRGCRPSLRGELLRAFRDWTKINLAPDLNGLQIHKWKLSTPKTPSWLHVPLQEHESTWNVVITSYIFQTYFYIGLTSDDVFMGAVHLSAALLPCLSIWPWHLSLPVCHRMSGNCTALCKEQG